MLFGSHETQFFLIGPAGVIRCKLIAGVRSFNLRDLNVNKRRRVTCISNTHTHTHTSVPCFTRVCVCVNVHDVPKIESIASKRAARINFVTQQLERRFVVEFIYNAGGAA